MEWKDGNTLLSDYRETILLRFNQYYKASKIFGTIIFVMISLILISFIYRIITGSCVEGYPSYLKYMGYISEGFSTLIIFIFWTGSLKLVIISNKVINLVRSGNFQYSYGQITDKYLGRGNKVNQCDRNQVEAISLIVSDLQDLVK